nr:hypothetical protein [Tanacetum cinerariifolium]
MRHCSLRQKTQKISFGVHVDHRCQCASGFCELLYFLGFRFGDGGGGGDVVNVTRLRFCDTSASFAAICFFRGVSLYVLGEMCVTWALSGLSSSDSSDWMDLFAFIQVADPTKVKVGEQECAEGKARLLDSTIRCVVLLLPIASARVESELKASVERLFDKGGSADQWGSSAGGDHGVSSEAAIGGKSPSTLRELLASSMLNVKVGAAVATLLMVTYSVSTTPAHGNGVPADSITGLNIRTIGASKRFVISSDYSYHSTTNDSGAEGDSIIRYVVVPPDSDSSETVKPDPAGPSYSARQDLSMDSRELDAETMHQVFVPQWNVLNDSLLDVYDVSQEFVDHLAALGLFSHIREMDYHHLFTKFNVGTACQACLNAEVRMRTEYCLSERKRLESECKKQAHLLKARDEEIENLKAQLLLKEIEAAEAFCLRAQVSATEDMEKMRAAKIDSLKRRNVALENEKDSLDGKKDGLVDQVHALETTCSGLRDQLDTNLLEMALYLDGKFYPHLLTTISGRRWLLTHGMKLSVVKCLNSQEYLSALGAAISRAIEKGMHDGLSTDINYGKANWILADVVAYNPVVEADYNFALRRLREVDFSLLSELKSHKDASVEDIMNLLRLEGPLADAPGMSDLQRHVDQLMLSVHRFEDQMVLGETSLSFALSFTHSRVERITKNVAAKRSALIGVWTPLVDPLSVENLMGKAGTSNEDYEIVGTDGPEDAQGNGQGNVASFPTVEFEKEELDTTPEHDPPS